MNAIVQFLTFIFDVYSIDAVLPCIPCYHGASTDESDEEPIYYVVKLARLFLTNDFFNVDYAEIFAMQFVGMSWLRSTTLGECFLCFSLIDILHSIMCKGADINKPLRRRSLGYYPHPSLVGCVIRNMHSLRLSLRQPGLCNNDNSLIDADVCCDWTMLEFMLHSAAAWTNLLQSIPRNPICAYNMVSLRGLLSYEHEAVNLNAIYPLVRIVWMYQPPSNQFLRTYLHKLYLDTNQWISQQAALSNYRFWHKKSALFFS